MFENVSKEELENIVKNFPRGKAIKVILATYEVAKEKITLKDASAIYDEIKQELK